MERISVRVSEDVLADLEAEADENGVTRSAHIRDLLSTRAGDDEHTAAHEARTEDLEAELDDLRVENERLHRERRQLLEQREENTELVRYAEEQRLESQSDKRRREHNIVRRVWWKVAGEPAEI